MGIDVRPAEEELGELIVGTVMLQGEWTEEVYQYVKEAYHRREGGLSPIAKTVLVNEFFEAIDLVRETQTRKYTNLKEQYLRDTFAVEDYYWFRDVFAAKNGRLYQRLQQLSRFYLWDDRIRLDKWEEDPVMGPDDPSDWQIRTLHQIVDAMGQEEQTYQKGQF